MCLVSLLLIHQFIVLLIFSIRNTKNIKPTSLKGYLKNTFSAKLLQKKLIQEKDKKNKLLVLTQGQNRTLMSWQPSPHLQRKWQRILLLVNEHWNPGREWPRPTASWSNSIISLDLSFLPCKEEMIITQNNAKQAVNSWCRVSKCSLHGSCYPDHYW